MHLGQPEDIPADSLLVGIQRQEGSQGSLQHLLRVGIHRTVPGNLKKKQRIKLNFGMCDFLGL